MYVCLYVREVSFVHSVDEDSFALSEIQVPKRYERRNTVKRAKQLRSYVVDGKKLLGIRVCRGIGSNTTIVVDDDDDDDDDNGDDGSRTLKRSRR